MLCYCTRLRERHGQINWAWYSYKFIMEWRREGGGTAWKRWERVSWCWCSAVVGQTSWSCAESSSGRQRWGSRVKVTSTFDQVRHRWVEIRAEDRRVGLPAVHLQVQRLSAGLQAPRHAGEPPCQASPRRQHCLCAWTQHADSAFSARLLLSVLWQGQSVNQCLCVFQYAGCWYVGGDDLTGAFCTSYRLQLSTVTSVTHPFVFPWAVSHLPYSFWH